LGDLSLPEFCWQVVQEQLVNSFGGAAMAYLKKGDRAPDFTLTDQFGKTVKLRAFKGRNVLLYFFPKAGTSG
jgi:cytochrome oxidase Cu insertion factor (SCO1/SenC/PrrC family)